MSSICEHCNEPQYDAEEQVCKACGIVSEGTQFGSEFHTHSSIIPYGYKRKKKRIPDGLTYGMDILNSLSNKYNISSAIKSESTELLKDVYYKNFFKVKEDIGVLAGCCLITVQKKYKIFVHISDLCEKLKCTKKSVHKFLKMIRNCQETHDFGNVDDPEVKSGSTSSDYLEGLESTIQGKLSSVPEEDKTELIRKTTALVKLAYSLWVGSGRSTEGVIVAAAFLCWKSMHPSRRTFPFSKFCAHFSLNNLKGGPRVSELKEMLLKLSKGIPSLTRNFVNEKNVLFHLDYILEHSETLRNDLLTEEFTADEVSKKEFAVFRKPKVKTENKTYTEAVQYDPDMCASDIEISDTEIDSYLRTEEQVEMIKSLRESKGNLAT